ncbi:MAG: hypothetical protein WA977_00485 [Halobacteriota archaeon]
MANSVFALWAKAKSSYSNAKRLSLNSTANLVNLVVLQFITGMTISTGYSDLNKEGFEDDETWYLYPMQRRRGGID